MSYIKDIRDKVSDDWLILNASAVVIVNDKNQILLQKRADNGLWGLPGGLLELEDSISQCAIREVKEETNLDIELSRFIGVFNNPFMRWRQRDCARVISYAFLGKVIGSSLKVNDHESLELRYFNYYDLPIIHSIDTLEIIQAYYHNQFGYIEGELYHG
ncbi:NUDIX domain-containing protein [Hujiaoplasma nucleasis]|uniref:NUDIX domain-containing protein n=1 Tax=Hujiaoplasma nucleasis TaxID=2725268 RepID=A0A7L6N058_9MOLU|nr:NUDIX domain-containing protein [Hujiaoplasma nucleasis]QLY39640.1 NUDIX domain-containing protein [Hujiaoplasma nucleasis]